MDKEIVISVKTLFVAAAFVFAGWVLIKILPLILALFLSLLLTLALTPVVDFFQSKKIPRGLGTFLLFLTIISFFSYAGITIVKPLTEQTRRLIEGLPLYIDRLIAAPALDSYGEKLSEALINQFSATSTNVLKATLGAFSSVIFIVTIFVFTFYLLVEFDEIKKMFINFFPTKKRKKVENIVLVIEKRLGAYLRGQLTLAFIVGSFSFIGLELLGVDYSLSLALIAGALEIVPVIGPVIATIPALIVASGINALTFFGVLGLYFLIQQLENNLLVPKVMERALGFNPLISLLLILTGGTLFGVLGIILAIPTALVCYIVLSEISEFER